MSSLELQSRYVSTTFEIGCSPDQTINFARAGILLQPKQLQASAAARLCDHSNGPTEIGYGGARGGGKSHWLLAQMGADDCQRYPGLKCLLLRKVGKSNLENFDDLRRRLFLRLPHDFTPSKGTLTFKNGSRIIAGHYQSEKDIDAYLGLEYDLIGVEEATTLTHRKYIDIGTCCRTSKKGWRPRIYSTTNPGGIGHAWYRNRFVTPYLQQSQTDTRFIAATILDNQFTNPEYAKNLSNLRGWQKRAWFHGDWDIAAGQFFTNFRRELHVINDFDLTRAREWFAGMDYGYTHYTVFLLACKDHQGNTIILDEHAERLWLPARHMPAINAMLHRHQLGFHRLSRVVGGADMFSRQFNGSTIASEYKMFGLNISQANTDRINGWADILRSLGDSQGGQQPTLFIHERCRRLIDCLPNLQHDPNRPEDVLKVDVDENGDGGDDPADALRYLIHTRLRTIVMRKLKGF